MRAEEQIGFIRHIPTHVVCASGLQCRKPFLLTCVHKMSALKEAPSKGCSQDHLKSKLMQRPGTVIVI